MTTDLMFWYTGWAVWVLAATVLAVGVAIISGIALAHSYWYVQNWMKLHAMLKKGYDHSTMQASYQHACDTVGIPFPDNPDKATLFLFAMATEYRKRHGTGASPNATAITGPSASHCSAAEIVAEKSSEELKHGDYVLATKYHDGDPSDQWAVGFFDHAFLLNAHRFMVVNSDGKQLRGNGFRRCEKIPQELGKWLIDNVKLLESGNRNLWDYVATYRACGLSALVPPNAPDLNAPTDPLHAV